MKQKLTEQDLDFVSGAAKKPIRRGKVKKQSLAAPGHTKARRTVDPIRGFLRKSRLIGRKMRHEP